MLAISAIIHGLALYLHPVKERVQKNEKIATEKILESKFSISESKLLLSVVFALAAFFAGMRGSTTVNRIFSLAPDPYIYAQVVAGVVYFGQAILMVFLPILLALSLIIGLFEVLRDGIQLGEEKSFYGYASMGSRHMICFLCAFVLTFIFVGILDREQFAPESAVLHTAYHVDYRDLSAMQGIPEGYRHMMHGEGVISRMIYSDGNFYQKIGRYYFCHEAGEYVLCFPEEPRRLLYREQD